MTEPLWYYDIEKQTGYQELITIMSKTLHPNKSERVQDFFTYPLPIVNISNDITGDINRVFDSRNANFDIDYGENKTLQQQAEDLLTQVDVRKYVTKEGKKVLKNKPNTFVVVDKDKDGNPFLLSVHNKDVIGYQYKSKRYLELEFFIFNHSTFVNEAGKTVKRIGFYDSDDYWVVESINGNLTIADQVSHDLGYTPAYPFLMSRLNSENEFDRFNPFAPALSAMATWTLFDVYIRYNDHMNSFPITERAKPTCSNDNCDDGWVSYPLENGGMSKPKECPVCAASKVLGPGTMIDIDAAQHSEEKDPSGMFRFISPPIQNAEYAQTVQTNREREIKESTKGYATPDSREAMNVEQIRAIMEGARKPLLFISMQLNHIHKWIVKTVVKLSFDAEVNVHANYGTEWFLLTESEIQMLFKDSKEAGMPESELDQLYKLLVETKYKNDPNLVQKLIIENNVNPAPYQSVEECIVKFQIGVMSRENLSVKANFTALIKRFERENGSLVSFGRDAMMQGRLTFARKIETIYNELLKYVNQNGDNNSTEQVGEQGSTSTDSTGS